MKVITPLTIDDGVKRRAKEKRLNMSNIAERAIREKLHITEVGIDNEITECEFCNKEMDKATEDNPNGLTWIYPNEKWICPRCLESKSRRITKL